LSRPRGASHSSTETYDSTLNDLELNEGGAQIRLSASRPRPAFGVMRIHIVRSFRVHRVKSELSTRIVQLLAGWEQTQMVENISSLLPSMMPCDSPDEPTAAKFENN